MEGLTECERLLQEAFPIGGVVDLRDRDPEVDDPRVAAGWGSDRTIRAGVIRGLLLGSRDPEQSAVPAIRLMGARIVGVLDLTHANFSHPFILSTVRLRRFLTGAG
jgi:hypothetical protein